MFRQIFKYLLIFLTITLVSKESFALSGKDISEKISEWLLLEGVRGKPIFSKTSVYKNCLSDLKITKVFESYKTVKISCLDKNGFNLFVRINLKKSKKQNQKKLDKQNQKKSVKKTPTLKVKTKKVKKYKSIKLTKALEKNQVIELNDLDVIISNKLPGNFFFTSKTDLVGRKLKKILKWANYCILDICMKNLTYRLEILYQLYLTLVQLQSLSLEKQ